MVLLWKALLRPHNPLDDFAVTLEGEDGEMVMDTGARLTAFYGRLEAALLNEAA